MRSIISYWFLAEVTAWLDALTEACSLALLIARRLDTDELSHEIQKLRLAAPVAVSNNNFEVSIPDYYRHIKTDCD